MNEMTHKDWQVFDNFITTIHRLGLWKPIMRYKAERYVVKLKTIKEQAYG